MIDYRHPARPHYSRRPVVSLVKPTTPCDECRAAIPDAHPSMVNGHHAGVCSLTPADR